MTDGPASPLRIHTASCAGTCETTTRRRNGGEIEFSWTRTAISTDSAVNSSVRPIAGPGTDKLRWLGRRQLAQAPGR